MVAKGSSGNGYSWVHLAWTGTNAVITAVDSQGNLYFWWQDPSGNFHRETVATASGSAQYDESTITPTNHAVVIVAIRNATDLLSWYQPFGGKTWIPNGIAGGFIDDGFTQPSVTWTGSSVVVASAIVGTHPNVKYLSQSAPGNAWKGQFLPAPSDPGVSWNGGTAIAWTGSNVVVSAVDENDNSLYFWWQGGTTWHLESASHPSNKLLDLNPSMVATNGAVDITLTTTSGLFDWSQTFGATTWVPEHVAN